MALEIYSEETAKSSSFARVLLMGPAKGGKTTCLLKTCPQPIFVINADGLGATRGAVNQGAKFKGVDVGSAADWMAACRLAVELAAKGEARSIVVDTFSLLTDMLLDEFGQIKLDKPNSYYKFDLLNQCCFRGIEILKDAKAHLFIASHMKTDGGSSLAGIMPLIAGSSKHRIPALIDDWILLEVTPDGQRNFLLGPQKEWNASGRNIKRSEIIPADVGILLQKLSINP